MKNFKSYILMATGFAVLIAVVTGITSSPAVAAAVKAALVQNVDEPGRSPFLSPSFLTGGDCSFGPTGNCTFGMQLHGPAASTRLVIKDVSAIAYLNPGGKVFFAQLYSCATPNATCGGPANGATAINLPISLQTASAIAFAGSPAVDVWVANQQVDFYVEAGSAPEISFITDQDETGALFKGSVSGYTVSLP